MAGPLLDLCLSTFFTLFPKHKQVILIKMKLTTIEKRLLTFCCLVIVVFSYLLYDDTLFLEARNSQNEKVAQLITKKQDVRVKSSDQFSWMNAREQDSLYAYDSLFTGENSTAILQLNDGSNLQIDGQTLIVLAYENGQLVLDLKSGSLSGSLNLSSKLLVRTKDGLEKLNGKIRLEKNFSGVNLQKIDRLPAAQDPTMLVWKSPPSFKVNKQDPRTYVNLEWQKIGRITDTVVEISTSPEFSILDSVVKTKASETGIPFSLPTGQYYVRLKGYDTSKTQNAISIVHSFELTDIKRSSLPPPILLTQNIQHSDKEPLPPKVEWLPVNKAEKYRMELSRTPRFEKVVNLETAGSQINWNNYQPGSYFFRVYSMNEEEVSGPSDIGTIEVSSSAPQLQPIAPITIRTATGQVEPQKVSVVWSHSSRLPSKYKIEVSNDGTFRDARVVATQRGPASLQVQKPGQYHVRVFATNDEGEAISPSSNIESFNYQIKNLLPAPILIRPFNDTTVFLQQDDNPYLWLTWKPVDDAEQFAIEVATDKDFQRVIDSAVVNSTHETFLRYLMAKRIPYGKYFWRVKSVSQTEKTDSNWSEPYMFYLFHKKKEIFFE